MRASFRRGFPLLLCVAALAAGCRSMPPPNEQLAVARTAYNDAVEAGAAEYAAQELAAANAKLNRARSLASKKDYADARRMAEQAEIDARLAASRARSVRAGRELTHAEENLRAVSPRAATSATIR